MTRRFIAVIVFLIVSIILYFWGATGSIAHLRFWRFVLIVVVASSLSIAGLILQNILRNPLVEPYIIGVSSTGALGYAVGLILGIPFPLDGLMTVAGVILGFIPVYMAGRSPLRFILMGVAVGLFSSSVLSLLMAVNQQDILKTFYILWGNVDRIFSPLDITILTILGISSLLLLGITFGMRRVLMIMSLPQEEARAFGVDTDRYMRIFILIAFLLTGISVYLAGVIGFVGLVVPHISRMLFPDRMELIIPSSIVVSTTLLLISDTVIRTLLPVSIPVGIITSIVGVPFFVYLLSRW